MRNAFEWIFFDCFNTLIDDFDDTGDESGLGPMIHLPVEMEFFAAETEFRDTYDEWRRSRWTGDDWGEVNLADRLREILTSRDEARRDEIEALVNQMLSQFDTDYPDTLRPTPGVREMLQIWHHKVRMGVVSNFFLPDWPEKMLAKFGLAGFFDFILDSASFGVKKPGHSIYFEALRRAGISADQGNRVLFIGDNLTNDVVTPMTLGMKALYLDRSAERPASTQAPENIPSMGGWDEFRPGEFESF